MHFRTIKKSMRTAVVASGPGGSICSINSFIHPGGASWIHRAVAAMARTPHSGTGPKDLPSARPNVAQPPAEAALMHKSEDRRAPTEMTMRSPPQ
jgi:hypothetical protein